MEKAYHKFGWCFLRDTVQTGGDEVFTNGFAQDLRWQQALFVAFGLTGVFFKANQAGQVAKG